MLQKNKMHAPGRTFIRSMTRMVGDADRVLTYPTQDMFMISVKCRQYALHFHFMFYYYKEMTLVAW